VQHEREFNNFDFVRLVAASMVVVAHSYDLLGRKAYEPLRVLTGHDELSLGVLGVFIFFSMSGYLITQSLSRSSSLKTYFAKRALRIFPALILDILIAVFVFGVISTTLPLPSYFTDPLTWEYLGNFSLYHISYQLPGVFADHPFTVVNGSMWTLPHEFTCYVGLAVLPVVGLLKRRGLLLGIWFVALAVRSVFQTQFSTTLIFSLLPLALYFGMGALHYLYRDRIRYNKYFALTLLGLVVLAFAFHLAPSTLGYFIYPYCLLTFVFTPNRILGQAGRLGDFSYGTYIYSFPLQQMIIQSLGVALPIWEMIALSFLLTIPFAALSWFTVERPALKLKDRMFTRRSIEFSPYVPTVEHMGACALKTLTTKEVTEPLA